MFTYRMKFAWHTLGYPVDIAITPSCKKISSGAWKKGKTIVKQDWKCSVQSKVRDRLKSIQFQCSKLSHEAIVPIKQLKDENANLIFGQ